MPNTKKRRPSVRSKRKIEFVSHEYKLCDPMSSDGPIFGEVTTVRVREGTILYLQCWNGERSSEYGLVPGFIASPWYKRGSRRAALVNPLTEAGRKKYAKKFGKLLRGNVNFW